MALHAHNGHCKGSTIDYPPQLQPQWQQPTHECDPSARESNQTAETSQRIFSAQTSEPQTLEQEHTVTLSAFQQSYYDLEPSSQSAAPKPEGGPMATAPFLKDFNLVAEAARRAQMAVMMREMESVKL